MKKIFLFIFIISSGIAVFAGEYASLLYEIKELYIKKEYSQAMSLSNKIENLVKDEDKIELVFIQGLIYFQQKQYEKAYEKFKIIDSEDKNSIRYKDAVFFLELIALNYNYKNNDLKRTIRVLIGKGENFTVEKNQAMQIYDLKNRKVLITTSPNNKYYIQKTEHGILVNNKVFNSDLIEFKNFSDNQFFRINNKTYRGNLLFIKYNNDILVINKLNIEDYLKGVLPREIPSSWGADALKAQAISARSYAYYKKMHPDSLYYDLQATWMSQVYGGVEAETLTTNQAIIETKDIVMTYNNDIIPGYFHSDSGGYIEDAADVWGKSFPFLKAKKDPFSGNSKYGTWKSEIKYSQIRKILKNQGYGLAKIIKIGIYAKSSTGRTKKIFIKHLRGKLILSAAKFRLWISPVLIRSTFFTRIENHRDKVIFSGRGWGHGVGLSQWGAKAMDDRGYEYDEILNFYYNKIRLNKLNFLN